MNKEQWRAHVQHVISHLSVEEKQRQSRVVCTQLIRLVEERAAQVILVYNALEDEVALEEFLAWCFAHGKTVLLPKVLDAYRMEMYHVAALEDCVQGSFGVWEPGSQAKMWGGSIDVAVVPGRVFAAAGGRIGRGKGYYDRFLTNYPVTYKVGVCFTEQVIDTVPMQERDVPMDIVIEAKGESQFYE